MPLSPRPRATWLADCIEQAGLLTLHTHTGLQEALALTPTQAGEFFESKAFASFKTSQENKRKITDAYFARLDGLARGISALGKLIANIAKSRA